MHVGSEAPLSALIMGCGTLTQASLRKLCLQTETLADIMTTATCSAIGVTCPHLTDLKLMGSQTEALRLGGDWFFHLKELPLTKVCSPRPFTHCLQAFDKKHTCSCDEPCSQRASAAVSKFLSWPLHVAADCTVGVVTLNTAVAVASCTRAHRSN